MSDKDQPMNSNVPHMEPEAFRRVGHQLVDWIADYWDRVGDLPVRSQVAPGEVLSALPERAPEQPGDAELWADIVKDLEEVILPGMTHWQHPRFHAYFPAGNSFPSILADMLAGAIGCVGFSWVNQKSQTSCAIPLN